MKYGLIGEKLGHSYSPELHGKFASYTYELAELSPDALADFLRSAAFEGINVTIPYKTAVLPYLYAVDDGVKATGAVNTVCRRGDKLYGYNTDVCGLTALISHIGVSLVGRTVLVLGSGGTSKTAVAVCKNLGAAEVVVVGRTAKDGVITYQTAYQSLAHASYIINTTPVGMFPHAEGMPIDLAAFPNLCGVADTIYNPLRTNLVLAARKRGIPAAGGLYMLVAQAVAASEHFLDTVYPAGLVDDVYRQMRSEKENIVLIGMPGCGKSTVGAALSAALHRPFVDTDAEIVRRAGKSIPEIFATEGEAAFRALESAVIADLSGSLRGAILATGGGAVLSLENCKALARGGRLYFLDRDIRAICPTADRPLSADRNALLQLFHERYPIYNDVADVRIAIDEDVSHTVSKIKEDFFR